ncbi:DnaD domain-containing protein [Macrococcoides bohemicum]|uniref:DnaD domain-containing protein n=1 Tax=Macrococcoides bohemicum TaxID=1903056 RepID=UPI00194009AA|nr:DnaD domain protein [Macrococcus bohemicus]QRN49971.1 DnaD domain protein [Macrococcus bohemicus]
MTGWISLHRTIENHWLYEEDRKFSKFEAWIDILLMVNHTDKKVTLGNELIIVKRGQKITSIRKLCDRWQWSNNKVKHFLDLLQEDGMLKVKSDTKKTVLTVVNYDVYQNQDIKKRHNSDTKETQKHFKRDTNAFQKHTNNNVNNDLIMTNNDNNVVVVDVNENKSDFKKTELENNDNNHTFQELLNYYQNNIQMSPPPAVLEKLGNDYDDFGFNIVKYAINKSAINNNHNYNFVDWLLKDWNKKGLKTIEAIEQYENSKSNNKFKRNKQKEMQNNYPNKNHLSFAELEMKKSKFGISSFTDEELEAYESYY